MAKTDEPELRKQMQQLDELIAWFEQSELDIEEAITKFEEGSKLAEDIKNRLQKLENKVTVLKQKFDQAE